MGRIVMVGYKPKPGKEADLDKLMETHLEILRQQKLATSRESILMKSKDGTVIEVFEWESALAIEEAHSNPVVMKMWEEYEAVCDYVPIASISEASDLFSEFVSS